MLIFYWRHCLVSIGIGLLLLGFGVFSGMVVILGFGSGDLDLRSVDSPWLSVVVVDHLRGSDLGEGLAVGCCGTLSRVVY